METGGAQWRAACLHEGLSQNNRRHKRSFTRVSGLENIFLLTIRKKNELRVDMEDWDGGKAFAQYSSFAIESENSSYQLHLGSFTAGDAGERWGIVNQATQSQDSCR